MVEGRARKTFTVTLEIIDDCFEQEATGKRTTWVILSRGERQALEAITEAKRHAEAYLMMAGAIEQSEFVSTDGKRRFTQFEIRFAKGSRIIALPANPDTARGYSANIFLDEFCIHERDEEIWRALLPVLRGRFRVIVASTPKGGRSRKFYQIMHDESGIWSKHTIDVYEAVRQGLPLDIDTERKAMGDPDGWAQEFELQWLDEASAWLPFELLATCEDNQAGDPTEYAGGICYLGNDIARRNDLWVAWVLERVGDVLWTREVSVLRRATFAEQDAEIDRLMKRYRVVKLTADQTGMGERSVETYQAKYGRSKVEGILFTNQNKQGLALLGKAAFENRSVRVPDSPEVRDDLYKLKRSVTAAGSIRFDAERDEAGHADRAWALFLALNAASQGEISLEYQGVKRGEASPRRPSIGTKTELWGY
ncbi:MAG: terminase [Alkalinema sp. FL-bin-369]|nr:terminase [Leptolyngbyaceae cyanobacterium LF-bin-369]